MAKKFQKIMLIDDDSVNNFLNQKLITLCDQSVSVKIATNGKEALHILEKQEYWPDVIFLDINMPVMNGLEFLDAFHSKYNNSTVNIYVLSSSEDSRDIEQSKKRGISGYLNKPLNERAFKEIICGDVSECGQ